MAISECLSLSKENRINPINANPLSKINETGLQDSPDFPVAIYLDDVTSDYVSRYWHKEFEIGFITDGTVSVGCCTRKYIYGQQGTLRTYSCKSHHGDH